MKPTKKSRAFRTIRIFQVIAAAIVSLITIYVFISGRSSLFPQMQSVNVSLSPSPSPTQILLIPILTPSPTPTPIPSPLPTSTSMPQVASMQPPPDSIHCGAFRSDGGKNWTIIRGGLATPPCDSRGFFSYTPTPTSLSALFFDHTSVPIQSQFVDVWVYIPASSYATAEATYTLSFVCSSDTSLTPTTWQRQQNQQQGWLILDTYQIPACSSALYATLKVSSDDNDQAYLAEDAAALYFH